MRTQEARTHYYSVWIKVKFLKITLGDVLYSWPTAWGMIMHYPNPPCVNVPCAKISQTRYVATYIDVNNNLIKHCLRDYKCALRVCKLQNWQDACFDRTWRNWSLCPFIEKKTAKRKNTEDDKTSSLDPRKSESCFDLSFMIHPFHQSWIEFFETERNVIHKSGQNGIFLF